MISTFSPFSNILAWCPGHLGAKNFKVLGGSVVSIAFGHFRPKTFWENWKKKRIPSRWLNLYTSQIILFFIWYKIRAWPKVVKIDFVLNVYLTVWGCSRLQVFFTLLARLNQNWFKFLKGFPLLFCPLSRFDWGKLKIWLKHPIHTSN